MVERARERLATEAAEGRVEFTCQDLAELTLPITADRVFSNAVFHWIPDQPGLFRRLAAVLVREDGWSPSTAGTATWPRRWPGSKPCSPPGSTTSGFPTYRIPWTFNGPEETAGWLEDAGFESPECWLQERWPRPEDPRGFFAASFLAPVRELLPDELFPSFWTGRWPPWVSPRPSTTFV